ncbi:Uncharacterized protein Fot_03836 [Forsythia ovata]|uniref:Uncharacterized protein n=1 Tax=Forsythia ovata TaxID=205694 RepID=A0ABD1XBC4_9LAMI
MADREMVILFVQASTSTLSSSAPNSPLPPRDCFPPAKHLTGPLCPISTDTQMWTPLFPPPHANAFVGGVAQHHVSIHCHTQDSQFMSPQHSAVGAAMGFTVSDVITFSCFNNISMSTCFVFFPTSSLLQALTVLSAELVNTSPSNATTTEFTASSWTVMDSKHFKSEILQNFKVLSQEPEYNNP